MGQSLASDSQKLHQTATRILAERGPCEIAAQRGFLKLTPHEGGVTIDALSETRRPLFSLSINRTEYAFAANVNVKDLEAKFGPADDIIAKIGRTIGRAALHGTIVEQNTFRGVKLPPALPDPAHMPQEGSLAWERLTLVTKLNTALSDSTGAPREYRLFASGDRSFDIRRDASDPGAFLVEVQRLSGLNDYLTGSRITISKDKASYFLPDAGAPDGDERTATDTLRSWLTELKLL